MSPRSFPPRARRRTIRSAALAALLVAGITTPAAASPDAPAARHLTGTLGSGATYVIDVPENWNGTVLLFSHGYRPTGSPNPATDAPDEQTGAELLAEGYALAGSSYARTGWAVREAVPDQLATLDVFAERVGDARRTLAVGESYGGLVTTTIAERHPQRIDGSLSMCGLVHGGVANWNNTLDPVFALRTLLAPGSGIELTGFGGPDQAAAESDKLGAELKQGQRSESGRARIALAAALHNIPAWNDPDVPEPPAEDDYEGQQRAQYPVLRDMIAASAFSWRQEAEARAGGNMSWNAGVDYAKMLRASPNYPQVKALYKAAGRSLSADLAKLGSAPRIGADPAAVRYMKRHVSFTGELRRPQLDLHTTGDGLVPVQVESAHRGAVRRAGESPLLRQAYVRAAGHCTFSPGETTAAVKALDRRVHEGRWSGLRPGELNAAARESDPASPARYLPYRPAPYPRPYDLAPGGD